MRIDKKQLFSYLDFWTFTSKSELKSEINQLICASVGATYYTERKQTPRLCREYIKTRNLIFNQLKMATITQNRDYIEYHVKHLQEKYGLDQLRFDRKHNKLYIQSKIGRQKPIIYGIKEIIAYIDGLYEGIKIMKKTSELTSF